MNKIRSLLKPDERIMTVGRYNVNNFTAYPYKLDEGPSDDHGSEFGWNTMKLRKSSAISFFNFSEMTGKSSAITDDPMEYVQYNLTTYDANKANKLGEIMYSMNFIRPTDGFKDLILEFIVNGKIGMYENVVRVFVDYRSPEGLRKVFFVVKK
jgi:hypothetical protein